MNRIIEIYTDGACSQNGTWEGGWGFYNKIAKIGCRGYELKTTNNRMELTAVIMALKDALESSETNFEKILLEAFEKNEIFMASIKKIRIIIYTDSSYVANAYNKKWINNWKKNGWKNAKKEAVKNKDLWEKLDNLIINNDFCTIEFVKVKGHSGIIGNEIADSLATSAMKNKIKDKEYFYFHSQESALIDLSIKI